MRGQVRRDQLGYRHDALTGLGLRRPEREPAVVPLIQLPGNLDRPGLEVDVGAPQRRQLALSSRYAFATVTALTPPSRRFFCQRRTCGARISASGRVSNVGRGDGAAGYQYSSAVFGRSPGRSSIQSAA
jgi:hypothetical protein